MSESSCSLFDRFPLQLPTPHSLGRYTGRSCIIVGSSCWGMLELRKAQSLHPDADLIGINDSPILFGFKPAHWVSLHADRLECWGSIWRSIYKNGIWDINFHTNKPSTSMSEWLVVNHGGGSLGLAIIIAMYLGYSRIYVVGCPLDDTPRASNYLMGIDHKQPEYAECFEWMKKERLPVVNFSGLWNSDYQMEKK